MNTIIVNAVGAITGGGESILRQCLNAVASEEKARSYKWVFFVSKGLDIVLKADHIRLERIEARGRFSKLLWYQFLLNRRIRELNLRPSLLINLMNSGVPGVRIPQIIYIQQSLSFGDFREFKAFEFKARFYRWAIWKWMKRTIRQDSTVIVQTNWMKEAVSRKLGISKNLIHVIRPEIEPLIQADIEYPNHRTHRLLYPAVPSISYKNHELPIRMLSVMKETERTLYSRIKVIFTCKPEDSKLTKYYYNLARKLGVDEKIDWKGYLSKNDMVKEYIGSDIVLFPSKLETFGLPLAEAASLGKPILVIDKPYAHDVLGDYDGVKYLEDNPLRWASEIESFFNNGDRFHFAPVFSSESGGWKRFISLIVKQCQDM